MRIFVNVLLSLSLSLSLSFSLSLVKSSKVFKMFRTREFDRRPITVFSYFLFFLSSKCEETFSIQRTLSNFIS